MKTATQTNDIHTSVFAGVPIQSERTASAQVVNGLASANCRRPSGIVLAGRTFSDVLLNCLSLVVLFAVGFAAGFNFIDATAGEIVLGIVLLLLLGYAFSWIFALVGLFSSTPETANSIGFTLIFPLTFASSVFVPAATMPDGLRQFAEVNPFTTISDAMRSLWLGTPAHSDIWMAFVWCFVLIAIFAPLAVARYRNVAAS